MQTRRQFSETCNHLNYKVIFLGDFGVGKSTLFQWLRDGEPPDPYNSITRVGIDKCSRSFTLECGQPVQMEFWDTAGSERYRTLTKNYYRFCNAIVLVYDVSDPTTLSSLKDWIEDAKRYAPSNAIYMLLANKYDLRDAAETQTCQLGEAFAELHDIPLYFKISAKSGDKNLLSELFQRLAEYIHNKQQKTKKNSERFDELQVVTEDTAFSIEHQLLEDTVKCSKKSNCVSCLKR